MLIILIIIVTTAATWFWKKFYSKRKVTISVDTAYEEIQMLDVQVNISKEFEDEVKSFLKSKSQIVSINRLVFTFLTPPYFT